MFHDPIWFRQMSSAPQNPQELLHRAAALEEHRNKVMARLIRTRFFRSYLLRSLLNRFVPGLARRLVI